MKECSIIIASYNEADNLVKCLDSIKNIDFPDENYEIIVVDNNSTDNTAEIVAQYSQVIYLKEDTRGASFARNKGIREAKGNILVFLDADTLVTRNWLSRLMDPFKDPSTGAVGGAILPYSKNNMISEYLGISLFCRYPRYGKIKKIKGYPSCNLAVRKELGSDGFDTSVFSTYGEDKDLCYRILEEGHNVIFDPAAAIYHMHPDSLSALLRLFIKSSEGRARFSEKYPYAPDIILLNFHFPLIYTVLFLLSFMFGDIRIPFLIALPALLYLCYGSIISYIRSKKFILSFIIKPVLDILSVYVIYAAYSYYQLKGK